jgi:hypothetical protein
MSMGAKQQPAEVEQDTPAESAEEKVPAHV